jgi:hypothetical protein
MHSFLSNYVSSLVNPAAGIRSHGPSAATYASKDDANEPFRRGSLCQFALAWSQCYDRELQRKRCKNLQRHE